MITKRTVAIIPARGGSKGLSRKNLRLICERPLIAWTIRQAQLATRLHNVYVSTEDEEIADVSRSLGASVIVRPQILAEDTSSSESVLQHALEALKRGGIEPETVVFLQATSPIRLPEDIDRAIAEFEQSGADSLLSVTPWHGFLWREADNQALAVNYDYQHRPRRQDMPSMFRENGSIYIFKPEILERSGSRLGGHVALYKMQPFQEVDIDDEADLILAEQIMNSRKITQ